MAIKIYIDQGHNPTSPNAGAEGNGYREQDLVYQIGVETKNLLVANGNYTVRLSRPKPDDYVGNTNAESLRLRAEEANRFGADLFLSLHTNSALDPAVSGTEAEAYREGSIAYAVAGSIVDSVSSVTGLRNRGIFIRPGLYVLRKTAMPAVLAELGF
ncbi:MAG: N-acetylmuramoyl-L-alanine amidase, partial [Clostridia bacterium]|nr:N-acetylmuramoyl-L-alanine amidase [Clostridia bacterium]